MSETSAPGLTVRAPRWPTWTAPIASPTARRADAHHFAYPRVREITPRGEQREARA